MDCNKIKMMDVVFSSSVDGVGFRDVVFVAYCPHRCKNCHNPETWEWENGRDAGVDEVFALLTKSSITDVTFSGGEPFCQAPALSKLARRIKEETGKSIWVYSGYTFEEIIQNPDKRTLLALCDVLVDGRFETEKALPNLRFKGSFNQRILDIPKSLLENKPVLADI